MTVSPTLGLTLNASARLDAQPAAPWVLLGTAGSTRLELAHAHASLGVKGPVAALEVLLAAGADSAAFVVDFGDGDGFLQHFFGGIAKPGELGAGAGEKDAADERAVQADAGEFAADETEEFVGARL